MKRFLAILIFLVTVVILVFAATAGPNFPSVASGTTNAIGGGTVAWTNPNNIKASDGVFATSLPGTAETDDLIGTGFGFAIPATATINGILFEINISAATTNIGALNNVFLLKAGTAVGTNHGSTTGSLQPTQTTVSFGGSADLWGTTWTPTDINNANFGVAVTELSAGSGPGTISVDFFRLTVTYTVPAPTVTSVSPNVGTISGGTSVTVTGTNFFATPTSITFGGTAATSIGFTNSTTLTCVTPAHAAGAVNVVVTNPDAQTGTGTNVFTFNPNSCAVCMFQVF